MAEVTDEIRARIDIVELVGQRVALKRAGKDWKGLCPFHDDKNPSFQVSPTLGRYRCWSCGEHGDIFTWVMKTQNVEFVEALRILAAHAGVALPKNTRQVEPSKRAEQDAAMAEALAFFRNQLAKDEQARAYCERRGINEEAIQLWEIGYAPDEGTALATQLRKKNHSLSESRALFLVDQDSGGGYFDRFRGRLMFPIRDERGDLVAFGGRLLGDGHPKYVNSGDTPLFKKSRTLYGMYRAKDRIAKDRKAILTEGYLDVIACHKAGLTTAIASLGTALTDEHAKMLKRWCDGVIVLYDSDAAGQKAAERAIEVLEPEGLQVRIVLLPEGEDPDTLLRRDGPGALQRAVENRFKPTRYRIELLKRRLGVHEEEFWDEAIQLAAAGTTREIESYVLELAGMHPEIRDKSIAADRLRADIFALRKRGKPNDGQRVGVKTFRPESPLTVAEQELFIAFLTEDLREDAWLAFAEQEIFETGTAARLASSIRSAFEAPPSGLPALWIDKLPSEDAQVLIELGLVPRVAPVTHESLVGAVKALRDKRDKRSLVRGAAREPDDEAKKRFVNVLKKLREDARS